jgi:hypothetical protein
VDQVSVPLVLVATAVLTFLLSVWAAFLVPLRIGTVPVPVSLVLLASVLVLGVLAGRSAGWPGALLLALLWAGITVPLALRRPEGDLVVQGYYGSSLVGVLYLFGGFVGWAAVISRAVHRTSPPAPAGR